VNVFKVSGKKLLAGIGIILLLATTAGCSDAQKFSWDKLKETHYRMIAGEKIYQKMKTAQNDAANKGQADTGVSADQQENLTMEPETTGNAKFQVSLYFSDQNGDYLHVENREIAMVPGLARATVKELIAGPKTKGLLRTIPEGTQLLDIDVNNGLCRVDLSREFKENHWGGSSGEILTIYSLVDTLTQFASIKEVEILVEGQKVETLAGHMDLSTPVIRNMEIVKETK
jgi:spore germination protein GerM